jgi:hypothetical protein
MRRSVVALAVVVLSALGDAGSARAQQPPPASGGNKDAAADFFKRGRELREKAEKDKDHPDRKLIEQAREMFQRSVDASPSIGALYNLAACTEILGLHRQAIETYEKAAKLARDAGDPREVDATEAKAQILKRASWVKVHVAPVVVDLEELKIVVDGEEITRADFDTEIFRDHPTHTIVVSAKNRATFKPPPKENHGTQDVKLEDLPSTGVATGGGTPPGGEGPGPVTHSGGWGWPQWTGLAAIVVGTGVGAFGALEFATLYARQHNAMDAFNAKHCGDNPPPKNPDPTCPVDKATFDDARDKQLPVGFLYGVPFAVLVAGGIVLIVEGPAILGNGGSASGGKAPSPSVAVTPPAPVAGPGFAGFVMGGTF